MTSINHKVRHVCLSYFVADGNAIKELSQAKQSLHW